MNGTLLAVTNPPTTYAFDFFYCERHTQGSSMQITTSIDLQCTYHVNLPICSPFPIHTSSFPLSPPAIFCSLNSVRFYDRCGVCQGDGQSCGNCAVICDDHDACTKVSASRFMAAVLCVVVLYASVVVPFQPPLSWVTDFPLALSLPLPPPSSASLFRPSPIGLVWTFTTK